MPGYTYTFVSPLKRKLVCSICELPMREPVRITTCGHRYCDACLQESLSAGVFKCPDDDKPLDYAKIYADPDVASEIQASMIRCVHYMMGCRWIDKMQNLQSHLDICRYDTVPCPNSCSARLSKIVLEDHLKFTCPLRIAKCEFCSQEFTGEGLESHQGNCPMQVVWCENKCGARLQQRFLNNHMKHECHKRTTPCHYCKKEFVYETLQDHYYQCPRFPLTCPNRCDHTKIAREDLDKHVTNECPSAHIPCVFKDVGCKYMCPRFHLDKHLEDATKMHLSLMCHTVVTQDAQIRELTQQLELINRVTDGNFIWRITNVKAKMAEARKKANLELQSDSFYTSRYGYRLRASCFLNGNGSGEDTHISLYIRVTAGEYDSLLEWPFRLPISFQLLDQCYDPEKKHAICESFVPNPSWKHFQRPATEAEAMGFGYPKFISHEALRNGTYIKDDSLFFRIRVDHNRFIIKT